MFNTDLSIEEESFSSTGYETQSYKQRISPIAKDFFSKQKMLNKKRNRSKYTLTNHIENKEEVLTTQSKTYSTRGQTDEYLNDISFDEYTIKESLIDNSTEANYDTLLKGLSSAPFERFEDETLNIYQMQF